MPLNEDRLAMPEIGAKDMPWVSFFSQSVEDPVQTKAQGRVVSKDQHYAKVTPRGSKDSYFGKLPQWFDAQDQEVRAGRILPEWVQKWRRDYELFKQGQEIPLDGTPIRGWKMLTGAQQDNLIRLNILTVESLATMNAEAAQQVGMGAIELKRRAEAWLSQNADKESGAVKLADALRQIDILKETNATLTEKIDQLAKQVEGKKK
jgi:hypothetical protein